MTDAGETPKRKRRKRGQGEGTIYQREDGLWVASVLIGQRRRAVAAKTRGEVQKKLDELRRHAADGLLIDSPLQRATVAEFLAHWLESIRGTIRDTSWDRYRQSIQHITELPDPALGRIRLSALRPDHLTRLYAAKRKLGLSPRSVKYLHATLHRALVFAVRWGAVPRNVAELVEPPRVERHELRPPTIEEIGRLLDAAWAGADRLAPLWTIAVYSGCRLGELLAIQWADVDLTAGTLAIRRTLLNAHRLEPEYGEPKTARSRRTLALPAEAISALRTWRGAQLEERLKAGPDYASYDLVFCSRIGTPLRARNVQRDFKRALARVGLPRKVRFHDLRHFSATIMLAAGVHPKVASERLGHSTIAITLDLYSHAVQGLDVDAAERIERALRGG